MSERPKAKIQSYVLYHYGNLISHSEPIFDKDTKTWVAELESDYPRIIKDERKQNGSIMKVIRLTGLGEVRVHKNNEIEATSREECNAKVYELLSTWQSRVERIVVSTSASRLAGIGKVKDELNPIIVIISNLLRKGKEVITNSEIEKEQRPQKMHQYLRFLEQLELVESVPDGYRYTPLFVEWRKKYDNHEAFKTHVVGYVIQKHYPTIKDVFNITRLEPLVHMEYCYYGAALMAEQLIGRKEDSLMAQYRRLYGGMSPLRLRAILDELVGANILEFEDPYYVSEKGLWTDMLAHKKEIPMELAPIRA